jgi:transcriptional regulator with XRE-family HTH domain
MEAAQLLEQRGGRSPLAAARLARRLPQAEAAARAGLTEDEVRWLEEGRVYRFATPDDALIALLLYATALGVDHREARAIAGLPVPPKPLSVNPAGRLAVLAALAVALVALGAAFALPEGGQSESAAPLPATGPKLPPWRVNVDVFNGNGNINHTRRMASRIGALGYTVVRVGRADRFDYTRTAVFYQPGGEALAVRLARRIGVVTKPLPGGKNPRRLVVIVGPRKGPGQ